MKQIITLLLKLTKIDEIGWRMQTGGTAFESFLYQVSSRMTSWPMVNKTSRNCANSEAKIYVGIGR